MHLNNCIVTHGGHGSSYLRDCLIAQHGCEAVFHKPDTAFVFHEYFAGVTDRRLQRLSHQGYNDFPSANAIDFFKARSGFRFNSLLTIEQNMLRYSKWLALNPAKKAVFGHAFMLRFFSRNQIEGQTFLIRHPLHAYVSLTKRCRHPEYVEDLGGTDTRAGIEIYAQTWNSLVAEALSTRSKLVRYEFARADSKHTGFQSTFQTWMSGKRNFGVVSSKCENLLRELVVDNYSKLYDDWDLS